MATLHIFTKTDELDIPINSMTELQSRIPALPDNPSLYRLDAVDFAQVITLCYGDPDRDHATVTVITGDTKPHKQVYHSFKAATSAFLLHCKNIVS